MHLINETCLLKTFLRTLIFEDSDISLSVFASRTNLKLYNISVIPKMVKKVITNLDSSKASHLDCIAVVKNCEPELSYVPAEIFSISLRESCFFRLLEVLICGPCI